MLYLVPTPIGNLEDVTLRAIRILKEVDLILAEDTRVTRKLLNHLDISNPLKSFHIHNEHREVSKVIDNLKEGKHIALVTDAGMPGISDPGFLLVREVVRENLEFTVLPGPNAITPALVLSGFPTNEFYFMGFMPTKKGRQKKLTQLQERTETIVIYESPHRIGKLAKELSTFFPNRWVALVREISKLHEEVWRGLSNDFPAHIEDHAPRGEMVVIISPKDYEP